MAWLPNPFKSLGVSDDDEESPSDTGAVAGGVKDDLSEIGETIGRQLRGVAEFLAPPPRSSPSLPEARVSDGETETRSPRLAGVRSDLAEISGSFKSLLSSRIGSSFLRRKGGDDHGVEIGITEEVVEFVAEISKGIECWTDFPLSLSGDGFSMTQAQAEHISIIEKIVPSLADIRTRLRSDMSEAQFWMIYFILLIPRLDENSLNLLSTPEVIEARNRLLALLRNKRNSPSPDSKKDCVGYSSRTDGKIDRKGHRENNSSAEKVVLSENSVVSQGVQTGKETAEKVSDEEYADAASADYSHRRLQNEDTISFSDLESDDADPSAKQSSTGRGQDVGSYSSDGSSDWVKLNKNEKSEGGQSRKDQLSSKKRDPEGEEPSDWHKIHESDYLN